MNQTKQQQYEAIYEQLIPVMQDQTDAIAKMATLCCCLYQSMDLFDWVGFYRMVDGVLKVGPYQGTYGCLEIPLGKGVCGKAALKKTTQIVPDVNAIANHIACSKATQSEIVVPWIDKGELIAVLDIDSNQLAAFDQSDADYLTKILQLI